MKHLSILALEDATIHCIDSCFQILSRVNDFLRYQGKAPYYQVEIVGTKKPMPISKGLYTINPHTTIDKLPRTDLIFVPIICSDFSVTAQVNAAYTRWLIDQYSQGAEIASLCVGSFFVASTGLLDNRSCAIHWAAKNEFQAMYPTVNIVDETIMTDENRIYTCGGGYSFLNLILYVIEKDLGRAMSLLASKMFEIDIDRKSQYPFVIFMGQKRHADSLILQAQEYIEKHADTAVSVDALCQQVGMGRRTFERKFKKCTGNSVSEYVQRVKVEFAKRLLETSPKTINEIIYTTGYADIDAFRRVFKKYTSLSPLEYRKRYAGETH
jgi:transcriptional regulator GlxA family with amidase domain